VLPAEYLPSRSAVDSRSAHLLTPSDMSHPKVDARSHCCAKAATKRDQDSAIRRFRFPVDGVRRRRLACDLFVKPPCALLARQMIRWRAWLRSCLAGRLPLRRVVGPAQGCLSNDAIGARLIDRGLPSGSSKPAPRDPTVAPLERDGLFCTRRHFPRLAPSTTQKAVLAAVTRRALHRAN